MKRRVIIVLGIAALSILIWSPWRSRSRRRFLAHPFWRDYVVAYVLIGIGFTVVGVGASQQGPGRWLVLGPALSLGGAGMAIFCCAVGWSLWSTWRSDRSV